MRSPPPRWWMRLQWGAHRLLWDLTGGRLGTTAIGMPVLELVTRGHRSGLERRVLITYVEKTRAPRWRARMLVRRMIQPGVKNLRATPGARIRRRGKWQTVTARWLMGRQRDRVWTMFLDADDGYEAYEQMLERPVPIVALEPAKH